jgi:hypothetical protein
VPTHRVEATRLWLSVIRDIVLLGIGGAGMIREVFFMPTLDMERVGLFLGMIAGSAVLQATWLLRNLPTAGPSPPQQQSSLSPPS